MVAFQRNSCQSGIIIISLQNNQSAKQKNWEDFSIQPSVRSDESNSKLSGVQDVNPDGKLTYGSYLRLDLLLSSQEPGTRVPDERIFIITHQLCELTFKQMLFDFETLAAVFRYAHEVADSPNGFAAFLKLDEDYWRPGITAAGRLNYSATSVLPSAIGYLSYNPNPTFDSTEFSYFRESLIPASGFQSAQFRAVQAALGKRSLLDVKMYPAAFYRKHYGDHRDENSNTAVSPADKLIVQDSIQFASPVDDLAQELASALAINNTDLGALKRLDLKEAQFDTAIDKLRKGISTLRHNEELNALFGSKDLEMQMVDAFRDSLAKVIIAENQRRSKFIDADAGIAKLKLAAPDHPFLKIVRLVQSTDDALHGQSKRSFLSMHRSFVGKRIGEVGRITSMTGKAAQTPGTGGGGLPYLQLIHRHLIPHFPALVGFGR